MTDLHDEPSVKQFFKIKDARSVCLYPHNQLHIWQYVKYTKCINIAKNCKALCQIMCCCFFLTNNKNTTPTIQTNQT